MNFNLKYAGQIAYALKMWNVVGRHEQGTTHTNNAMEAFNHKFNSILSCHHPSVWTLIKSMKP